MILPPIHSPAPHRYSSPVPPGHCLGGHRPVANKDLVGLGFAEAVANGFFDRGLFPVRDPAIGEAVLERDEHPRPGTTMDDLAGLEPAAVIGHSLGEYTALAAAGYIEFDDALSAVAARGGAMAAAASVEPSGMAALLGVDEGAAEAICAQRRDDAGRLWVANLNAPPENVLQLRQSVKQSSHHAERDG